MTTNLSTDQIGIISGSVIGGVIGGVALLTVGSYLYRHSKDPKNDDNEPITVKYDDDKASGLSRRKKSHIKSKRSRRRSKK